MRVMIDDRWCDITYEDDEYGVAVYYTYRDIKTRRELVLVLCDGVCESSGVHEPEEFGWYAVEDLNVWDFIGPDEASRDEYILEWLKEKEWQCDRCRRRIDKGNVCERCLQDEQEDED